jgi:hypothetical protein
MFAKIIHITPYIIAATQQKKPHVVMNFYSLIKYY